MRTEMRTLAGARQLFADPQARSIADLYVWTMEAGLHGATSAELFDGYCRRLVEAGIRLFARPRLDANAASAMDRLWLHLAPPAQRRARAAISARGDAAFGLAEKSVLQLDRARARRRIYPDDAPLSDRRAGAA